MVSTNETPSRGRSPTRGNNSLDDDACSVWSDADSVSSRSTTISYTYFPIRERQHRAPVFTSRLKKGEQADKPVYEAWNIEYYPRKKVPMQGFKVLGVKIEDYDDLDCLFRVSPQPSVQADLADTHLQAIEGFQAKHKRCWATRALRGKGKTYEQDLEERCRKAPEAVRHALTQLILDRGRATSTHYRTRTWTVAVMKEQLRQRFTDNNFTEVKRHKLRRWKNPGPDEHMLYTVVIRGAETKTSADGAGFNTFAPFHNPWVHSDRVEGLRKQREERRQRETIRSKRPPFSPPYRTRSPSYRTRSPSYRTRARSPSPPSYRSWRSRCDSPPPSTRPSRFESPPPYRRWARSVSPSPVRISSSNDRFRFIRRPETRRSDDAPFPPSPTPPESFTPPPGVSAYQRPGMAPPAPGPYTSPFRVPPPPFPAAPSTAAAPPPPPSPGFCDFNGEPIIPAARPTPPNCLACRATRASCAHYSRYLPCTRPVHFHHGVSYHPPCLQCARLDMNMTTPLPPRGPVPPPGAWPYGGPACFGHAPLRSNNAFLISPPPPPPPGVGAGRPPSWYSQGSWDGRPVPPAPNPFSPLSTPPLTSDGRSSPVLSQSSAGTASRVRTPTVEEVVEEPEVEVRCASPSLSENGSKRDGRE